MWHPTIPGDGATLGSWEELWRKGWQRGPRASSVVAGNVRRYAELGHSYTYVGVPNLDQSVAVRVAEAIGVHGAWSQDFASMATGSAFPSWTSRMGSWRIISGTGAKLFAASDRGELWWDNGSTEGIVCLDVVGMKNFTTIWIASKARRDGWALVGSESFAGWTLQRWVAGKLVQSWSHGASGWNGGAGKWWIQFTGRQLRVFTAAGGTWAEWELPAGPAGTMYGIEQPAVSPGLVVKSIRWVPGIVQGVSGSIAAGNDGVGSGSWGHGFQTVPRLDRGDVGVLVWGINDCVAQSLSRMADGFEATISKLRASAWTSSESASFSEQWVPAGPPPPSASTSWAAEDPSGWWNAGTWVHVATSVGARARIPLKSMTGRTVGLRFADEPTGGTVQIWSVDTAGVRTLLRTQIVSGGTGYGHHAARVIRVPVQAGWTALDIDVSQLAAGGRVAFDGWHVEHVPTSGPRVIVCNVATLPASGVPSPWSTISPAKVADANGRIGAVVAGFPSSKVAIADIDSAIGGNAAMFSDGLHPNAAGCSAIAGSVAAALATTTA